MKGNQVFFSYDIGGCVPAPKKISGIKMIIINITRYYVKKKSFLLYQSE